MYLEDSDLKAQYGQSLRPQTTAEAQSEKMAGMCAESYTRVKQEAVHEKLRFAREARQQIRRECSALQSKIWTMESSAKHYDAEIQALESLLNS